MTFETSLGMAFRILKGERARKRFSRPLLGTTMGIAFSLIPLVLVIHVSNNMIRSITDRFIETSSYHMQVILPTLSGDGHAIARDIAQEPVIKSASIELQGYGLAYSSTASSGIILRGIDPLLYQKDDGFRKFIRVLKGDFDLTSRNAILLGQGTATKLGISVGEEIRVVTGRETKSGRFLPKIRRFLVKGILTSGYQEMDRLWVFLPVKTAADILSRESSKTMVGIKTHAPYGTLRKEIQAIEEHLPDSWRIYSWRELGRAQQENYRVTRALLIWIMSMIVIVAIITLSSSLTMFIIERGREIAIMKCLGASPRGIQVIYLFVGGMAGLWGSLIGIGLGLLLSISINQLFFLIEAIINAILSLWGWLSSSSTHSISIFSAEYYLESLPVAVQLGALKVVFIVTFLLSLLFSFLPAHKAGAIRPIELLRRQ